MNQTAPPPKNNRARWQQNLLIGFVGVSVLAALWFGWQNHRLGQSQNQLKAAIVNQKQLLSQLKQQEQIGERMRAAEVLNQAQKNRKHWSTVYEDLQNELQSNRKITFNHVEVSPDHVVQVQGEAQDLLSATGLLVLIDRSPKFTDGFIEYINPSGDEDNPRYAFSANFTHVPANDNPLES